ncbi:hypothetical protein WDU94_015589 [Cyamophila willieti]
MALEAQANNKRRLSQVSMSSDDNSSVPLKNRFKPLTDLTDMMEDEPPSDPNTVNPRSTRTSQRSSQRPRKDNKPPPVIVDGVFGSDNTAIQTLKAQLNEKFEYKYASGVKSFTMSQIIALDRKSVSNALEITTSRSVTRKKKHVRTVTKNIQPTQRSVKSTSKSRRK